MQELHTSTWAAAISCAWAMPPVHNDSGYQQQGLVLPRHMLRMVNTITHSVLAALRTCFADRDKLHPRSHHITLPAQAAVGSSAAVSKRRQNPPLQQRSSQTNPAHSKHQQQATDPTTSRASTMWQGLLPSPVLLHCSRRERSLKASQQGCATAQTTTNVPSKPRCLYTLTSPVPCTHRHLSPCRDAALGRHTCWHQHPSALMHTCSPVWPVVTTTTP